MVVENDITNKFLLSIIRGGRHTRVVRSILYDCPLAIRSEIDRLSKRRIRRGYSLVT